MHHLDLGLFQYQIEFTRTILKDQYGNLLVDEMDRRLAKIPISWIKDLCKWNTINSQTDC